MAANATQLLIQHSHDHEFPLYFPLFGFISTFVLCGFVGRRPQKGEEKNSTKPITISYHSNHSKAPPITTYKKERRAFGNNLSKESDAFNNTDNSNCSLSMDRPIQKWITWLWRTGASATTPSDAGIIHTSTCNTSSSSTSKH